MPSLNRPARHREQDLANRASNLHKALAGILRKLGLIGPVTPAEDKLLEIAVEFAKGRRKIADDRGVLVRDYLALPDSELDRNIPF